MTTKSGTIFIYLIDSMNRDLYINVDKIESILQLDSGKTLIKTNNNEHIINTKLPEIIATLKKLG